MFPSYRICAANQLTGFYMMGTLVQKGLKAFNIHFQSSLPELIPDSLFTVARSAYSIRNK